MTAKDEALELAREGVEVHSPNMPEHKVCAALIDALAQRDELLAELQNIANANPRVWHEEVRDQFQQWAQSRARAAIAKATGSEA